MTSELDHKALYLLAISLAIGLLIGVERGWHTREAKEGTRVAGLRTFTLIGILGGITGILTTLLGGVALGFIFFGFSLLITFSYSASIKQRQEAGITSLVAALVTFLLGALATMGYVASSLSAAIIVALLLRLKPLLHLWIQKIERQELLAALELLLISVVFLNIFPNKGLGPWQAFNPYQIWLMVVLVATISFVAYFAMKLVGLQKGVLLTGLISGFISSTVLTLHFSKYANEKAEMANLYSVGILLASSVMYLRALLLILILNPALIPPLSFAFFLMMLLLLIVAYFIWRKTETIAFHTEKPIIKNPLDLRTALVFGAFLSIITILINGIQQTFGVTGIYAFSGLSGLTDIDAITIALARMSLHASLIKVIVISVILATCANNLVKAFLAYFLGGRQMLFTVCLPLIGTVAIGLVYSGIYLY